MQEKLFDKDEEEILIETVTKITVKGGIVKNFGNLIGRNIIKTINYDGYQNKQAFKDFSSVNNFFYKPVQCECVTLENFKKDMKKTFERKNKMYKEKCYKQK